MTFRITALAAAALAYGMSAGALHAQNAPSTPADVAEGRSHYLVHCAGCHGPNGSGGRGADLSNAQLTHAPTDAALQRVIRQGIPGTEMPGSFQLTDDEIGKVAAYVRSLARVGAEALRGDAARGEQVYRARCLSCHIANGDGGVTGPTLSGVGSRRGPSWLRAKILDPAAAIPGDFRLVELTTRNGQTVTGVRINEDTSSIQLRSMDGQLRSYWKRDLASLARHADRTPMPSYRNVLNESDLDNLVAYLVSLKERRP